jgi:hypothetical protein
MPSNTRFSAALDVVRAIAFMICSVEAVLHICVMLHH